MIKRRTRGSAGHVVWTAPPEQQRQCRLEIHEFDTCSVGIDLGERVFSVSFRPKELTRRDWKRAMRLRRGYPVGEATLVWDEDGMETWESTF
jgi:hypothetical protein